VPALSVPHQREWSLWFLRLAPSSVDRARCFRKTVLEKPSSHSFAKTAMRVSYAAIFVQLSAQRRQASAHSFMSPIRSQSFAHSAQISAHSLQVCLW
jgi:hypothetical protein